jgi:hypothetical protein
MFVSQVARLQYFSVNNCWRLNRVPFLQKSFAKCAKGDRTYLQQITLFHTRGICIAHILAEASLFA